MHRAFAFIAKKILLPQSKSLSGFIVKLCIVATTVSVAGMLIASSLFNGFENTVTQKFYNSWGHIQITNALPQMQLFTKDEMFVPADSLVKKLSQNANIDKFYPYVLRSSLLYKKGNIQGIVLKGVNETYNTAPASNNIVLGKRINFNTNVYSAQIILSELQINQLHLRIGDSVVVYFFDNMNATPRARKLEIAGIYKTGLEENDKTFAYCDIRLLQKILSDTTNSIHGFEIFLKNISTQDYVLQTIHQNYVEAPIQVFSIKEKFRNVFVWIDLVKHDVWIVYIILVIVALINIVSSVLILILERTNMVGVLKSLGMRNSSIKKIFFVQTIFITGIGLLLGIALAMLLCYLQHQFHFIKLDPKVYYMSEAQVDLKLSDVFTVSGGILILVSLVMLIPSIIVSKISPISAVKYD